MDVAQAASQFGMAPAGLLAGDWTSVITDLFIHGGWAHAGMNAVGALAFGAPVARLLGLSLRGATGFFLFYLVCGVASNLGYAAVHPHDVTPLVGASGAVSGLFGGASRLIARSQPPSAPNSGPTRDAPPLSLAPLNSRTVVGTALAWVIVNAALGLLRIAPGLGDVQVAWEAHIAGYFAGLLLVAPFSAVFRSAATSGQD
jgi:membrane associated rhomboid family serine protease